MLNTLSREILKNFTLFVNSSLSAFFFAVKIAFFELSTPIPNDFFKLLSKLKTMHHDPVPISNIVIFFSL